jgi:pimeloyl-ACP methyl ester carboxylesterase
VIAKFFHDWERRLASVTTDRVVRPFEWGLDWLDLGADHGSAPDAALRAWALDATRDSDRFYHVDPPAAVDFDGHHLAFDSAVTTPHPENNTVRARFFPARDGARRRAVVVLPQWNADSASHTGLCEVLARFGVSALRLTLPYHDARMPPELSRADYIVSSNVGRTVQVCRQAVLDARRAVQWLHAEGYERIGIVGTSLGSCLAMLTAAHEPLLRAAAFNHVSPWFADVVWEGLSTEHVRQGLDGQITLDVLRDIWLPISPFPYMERVRGRKLLVVYGRYDLSFPLPLSQRFTAEFDARSIAHERVVLPCGHYSLGKAPFSWMTGAALTGFFRRNL